MIQRTFFFFFNNKVKKTFCWLSHAPKQHFSHWKTFHTVVSTSLLGPLDPSFHLSDGQLALQWQSINIHTVTVIYDCCHGYICCVLTRPQNSLCRLLKWAELFLGNRGTRMLSIKWLTISTLSTNETETSGTSAFPSDGTDKRRKLHSNYT